MVGCGGIGGIVSASLTESGHEVVASTTNQSIADAVLRDGFRLRGEGEARSIRGQLVVGVPPGTFDCVILATQPPQVEEAARSAKDALGPDGLMVCLQNGLCEDRIARIVGEDRVAGAVVAWGASMPEPGVYERTAGGGFSLGYMKKPADARLRALAAALETIGPVDLTDNLPGKRWSKLALNCAVSSLGTIGGDRLGALLQHRFVRRLALEIMSEVVLVARAMAVRLEKVSGTLDLDWVSLTPEERDKQGSTSLVAKHALLLAVGYRYRRMRSSMLAAIERGRVPAVDFLNGEVVQRGRHLGIPVPINERIRACVWSIARGEQKPELETLRRLYETSRT